MSHVTSNNKPVAYIFFTQPHLRIMYKKWKSYEPNCNFQRDRILSTTIWLCLILSLFKRQSLSKVVKSLEKLYQLNPITGWVSIISFQDVLLPFFALSYYNQWDWILFKILFALHTVGHQRWTFDRKCCNAMITWRI